MPTGREAAPWGPLPGRLAAEGGIRAAGLRSCLRNVLRSRPKPSVSDSSSPRLQECQRRAPLIPPVLGPRLSFVKLKIFPPGTSFCQRLRRYKGDGCAVSLPDSASLLFLRQGNREAETGRGRGARGLCHSWARTIPSTFLLQTGFLLPPLRLQTIAHQPDTQAWPSPSGCGLCRDSCQVRTAACQVHFLCSPRGGWAGTYLSVRLIYR